MTGDIHIDAKNILSRIADPRFSGEDLYLFAEKYAADKKLVHRAILLTKDLVSKQSDSSNFPEEGKNLVEQILLGYHTEESIQQKLDNDSIRVLALKRFEAEYANKQTIVDLSAVEKNFKRSNFKLENINLQLNLGEITGIIGPNANGKSTLLKIIVGDLLKDKGTLRYPSFEKNNKFPGWAAIKRKIAYIPQELLPWKGALREVLLYEASRHGLYGQDCELQVNFIIQRMGLSEYINLDWSELSGGYKLRFELAKALVWKPSFVVLDEPLANLDVSAQLTILNDLKNLAHSFKNPICVIITSQHIHEIEHVADNLLVLETGKVIYFGKPLQFKAGTQTKLAELSCRASLQEVRKALNLPFVRIDDRGYCLLVEITGAYELSAILELLVSKNIKVDYFRDITHSVKQIFYEND
jgi:ABC-2 type transport system ATP-binding protein